jgi:hypothetical protein
MGLGASSRRVFKSQDFPMIEQRMCLGTFSARERAAKQQFPLRELCILGPIRAFFDF